MIQCIDESEGMVLSKEFKLGAISEVEISNLKVNLDRRGSLVAKSSNASNLVTKVGFETKEFFFTNSSVNTFRGVHLQQTSHEVGKIVTLISGRITDFLVDVRIHSETFLNVLITEIDEDSPSSIYIPPGVGHGYFCWEDNTRVLYQYDDEFCSICDTGFSGTSLDKFLDFDWDKAIISEKDRALPPFDDIFLRKIDHDAHN